MRKIKTAQIFENNATKNLTRSSKRVSKNDNFEFKNTLNNAVKESNLSNQSPKDTLETIDKNVSGSSDAGELENGDVNLNDTKKDEDLTSNNTVEQYALAVNSLQMDIKPVNVEKLNTDNVEESLKIQDVKAELNSAFPAQEKMSLEKISSDTISSINNIVENQKSATADIANMKAVNVKPGADGKIKLDDVITEEQVELKPADKIQDKVQGKTVELNSGEEAKISKPVEKASETDEFKFEKDSQAYTEENTVADVVKPVKTNDLEVVKIKVGDGQQVSSEKLIEEVSKSVILKSDSSNEYELQLDPENLGKIKVKLLFEEGKLTVSMLCSNGKTANLLAEGISNLTQAIQQSTRSEVAVNVKEDNYLNNNSEQNARQNSSNQQNQNQQKNQDDTEFVDQMKLGLWEIENLKKQFATDFRFM